MSDFRICHLSSQDWQRAKSIRLRALASAPAAFCSKLEDEQALSDEQWQARLQHKGVATFVAQLCSNQEDIGMVVGGPYDAAAGLFSLWVDQRYRQLGIGSVLVDTIINWAVQQNYNQLFLDVSQTNAAAIKLYQSKQFQFTGETRQLDFGQGVIEEWQMLLILNQPKD